MAGEYKGNVTRPSGPSGMQKDRQVQTQSHLKIIELRDVITFVIV